MSILQYFFPNNEQLSFFIDRSPSPLWATIKDLSVTQAAHVLISDMYATMKKSFHSPKVTFGQPRHDDSVISCQIWVGHIEAGCHGHSLDVDALKHRRDTDEASRFLANEKHAVEKNFRRTAPVKSSVY